MTASKREMLNMLRAKNVISRTLCYGEHGDGSNADAPVFTDIEAESELHVTYDKQITCEEGESWDSVREKLNTSVITLFPRSDADSSLIGEKSTALWVESYKLGTIEWKKQKSKYTSHFIDDQRTMTPEAFDRKYGRSIATICTIGGMACVRIETDRNQIKWRTLLQTAKAMLPATAFRTKYFSVKGKETWEASVNVWVRGGDPDQWRFKDSDAWLNSVCEAPTAISFKTKPIRELVEDSIMRQELCKLYGSSKDAKAMYDPGGFFGWMSYTERGSVVVRVYDAGTADCDGVYRCYSNNVYSSTSKAGVAICYSGGASPEWRLLLDGCTIYSIPSRDRTPKAGEWHSTDGTEGTCQVRVDPRVLF